MDRSRLSYAGAALLAAAAAMTADAAAQHPQVCLKPGADDGALKRVAGHYHAAGAKYEAETAWAATATDGAIGERPTPFTITYSFVPDGTPIPAEPTLGSEAAPSNLFAFLENVIGPPAEWQDLFHQVFADWGAVTGITFVYEPNDDGAGLPETEVTVGEPGQIGVRGDIRIGGYDVDGAGGSVLAYNFLPEAGDMVIDTTEASYFGNSTNNYRRVRNLIAHEVGHGLGLIHVCPANETKLMEPFITGDFDGPQFDDVLGAQSLYGDAYTGNDAPGGAATLGNAAGKVLTLDRVSLFDETEHDFFAFALNEAAEINVLVRPRGESYQAGPQSESGSCLSGPVFEPARELDIGFRLRGQDGGDAAPPATGQPLGAPESLESLPLTAGEYVVEVFAPADAGAAQAYTLSIDGQGALPPAIAAPVPPYYVRANQGEFRIKMDVAFADPPVDFDWFKDGSTGPLTSDGRIQGASTATLTFAPPHIGDSGTYRLRVTDAGKAVTVSDPVTITVSESLPLHWWAPGVCCALLLAAVLHTFFRSRPIR